MKKQMRYGMLLLTLVCCLLLPTQLAQAASYSPQTGYETLDVRFWADEKPPVGFYINAASRYVLETVAAPTVGSTFGEWSVMGLARGQYTGFDYMNAIPATYYANYIQRVEQYVAANKGVLDYNKSTEWSRVMLALAALDYDATNVAGYDFIEKLSSSHRFSYRQGINGPIWELIALNTRGYTLYPDATNDDVNTTGKMIDYVLKGEVKQKNGIIGGWTLSGNVPDADMTGMALQAFAPYYHDQALYANTGATTSYAQFRAAVERGVVAMKDMQQPNGGYGSFGTINSESTVQVIVALTALGFDPMAKTVSLPTIGKSVSFVTEGATRDGVFSNNVIDALLSFWAPNSGSTAASGGFKHVTSGYDGGGGAGTSVNAMATDQALYGLLAYDRFVRGKSALYDMRDMANGAYKTQRATSHTITYDGNGITTTTTATASPYGIVILPWEANVYAWNTKSDGSGIKYTPGETLIMPEHAITLYAQDEAASSAANKEAVQKVKMLIDELRAPRQLTRDDHPAVTRARGAYDKLTDAERKLISNYSTLVTAEGKLNEILAQYDDELQVTNLMQTIESLAALTPLTIDYEEAIHNARRAYNALSAAQRLQITNIQTLSLLEAKMAILTDEAKIEHETSIEVVTSTDNSAKKVIALIDALPADNALKIADTLAVKKARIYYDALSAVDQQQVTNIARLVAAEAALKTLQQQALEQEQLEEELNTNTYKSMKITGKTLVVEASKTAGNFVVQLPMDVLQTLETYQLTTLQLKDTRGVQVSIDAQALIKELRAAAATSMYVEITQYNYDTGTFDVKLHAMNARGTATALPLYDTYVHVVVPYSFFVDAKQLHTHVVLRVNETEQVAVAHESTAKDVTLHLKRDGTFMFTNKTMTFTDLTGVKQAASVTYLANRYVIKGDNGKVNPHDSLSRAHFAAMVVRALGLQVKASQSVFHDTKGKWYDSDVQALYEAKIIQGTTPTTFAPNNYLTRQQVSLMMARVLRYSGIDTKQYEQAMTFKDINSIAPTARGDVSALVQLGIIEGENGYFAPSKAVTRAQLAEILRTTLAIASLM